MATHDSWLAGKGLLRTDRLNSGNVFKHFKNGKLYRVLAVIFDTENDVEAVLHQNIETGAQYVRSVANFTAYVPEPDDGECSVENYVPRFQFWDTAHGMSGED
jgi:hypothetical protein